jgi:phosphoglycolate phosphatase-like HAD superfamily hydrolase
MDNKLDYTNILNYDLFIFDFDGTLLDTEQYHCDA